MTNTVIITYDIEKIKMGDRDGEVVIIAEDGTERTEVRRHEAI